MVHGARAKLATRQVQVGDGLTQLTAHVHVVVPQQEPVDRLIRAPPPPCRGRVLQPPRAREVHTVACTRVSACMDDAEPDGSASTT